MKVVIMRLYQVYTSIHCRQGSSGSSGCPGRKVTWVTRNRLLVGYPSGPPKRHVDSVKRKGIYDIAALAAGGPSRLLRSG